MLFWLSPTTPTQWSIIGSASTDMTFGLASVSSVNSYEEGDVGLFTMVLWNRLTLNGRWCFIASCLWMHPWVMKLCRATNMYSGLWWRLSSYDDYLRPFWNISSEQSILSNWIYDHNCKLYCNHSSLQESYCKTLLNTGNYSFPTGKRFSFDEGMGFIWLSMQAAIAITFTEFGQ